MAFTPNSTVYLLDTPLDNNYKNQLRFSSRSSQYSYFITRKKHTFDDVTYQRKDNSIRVNSNIDDLWNVNYCMYRNDNFSTKWFYAFITKMEYVSAQVTDIFIETDVYQTWLEECVIKDSFVVREHVATDTIGTHIIDEGLEYGDYIMQSYEPSGTMGKTWNIIAFSDLTPFGDTSAVGNKYGNVVTGLSYYAFPNTEQGVSWLKETLLLYAGKEDAIVMIFTVPELVLPSMDGVLLGQPLPQGNTIGLDFFTVQKSYSSVDGYVPKNNKLFTNPYKFLYISNGSGQSAIYRYEDFKSVSEPNTIKLTTFGTVTPNPQIMLAPQNYKGADMSYEHGLMLEGFPMCSWTSDTYTAWLAQNSTGLAVGIVGSAVAVGAGIATGNALMGIGGIVGIVSQMAQWQQHSIQPDQSKGQVGSGSLRMANGTLDFYLSHMTIKKEYAKKIDDFFTMFGYKVNSLKIPETHSRQNWNYIKTIDINIDGAIPSFDMKRLKQMYDDGVTLWHSSSGFLNYDNSNNPIL